MLVCEEREGRESVYSREKEGKKSLTKLRQFGSVSTGDILSDYWPKWWDDRNDCSNMAPSIPLFLAASSGPRTIQKFTLGAWDPTVTIRQLGASIIGLYGYETWDEIEGESEEEGDNSKSDDDNSN